MPILGEGGMVRYSILQPKTAEPAIGQVKVYFLAHTALRTNAVAVADNQHPHHQLRIDRGPTRMAVILSQVLAQLAQIKALVDATQEMVRWNVILEIKRIEQSLLSAFLLSHHLEALRQCTARSDTSRNQKI